MSKETFKVICINGTGRVTDRGITIGKIYDAYHDRDPRFYYIKNDNEIWIGYSANRFITLADWRDKQIDKILNDD